MGSAYSNQTNVGTGIYLFKQWTMLLKKNSIAVHGYREMQWKCSEICICVLIQRYHLIAFDSISYHLILSHLIWYHLVSSHSISSMFTTPIILTEAGATSRAPLQPVPLAAVVGPTERTAVASGVTQTTWFWVGWIKKEGNGRDFTLPPIIMEVKNGSLQY